MKLRLDHTQTVLAVASALLVLTNVYLGATYLSAQDQRGRLASQLQTLTRALDQLKSDPSPDPATSPDAAPAFPKNPPGLELTDLVVQAARDTGTEVVGLHTAAIGTEQIGAGTYRVVRVNLRLRADPGRLSAFFGRMEQGAPPTLVFDNVDVVRNGDAWEASLDLLAYAQGS